MNAEQWPYAQPLSAGTEVDQQLKPCEHSYDDVNDTATLSDVSPIVGATHAAHDLGAVSTALNMYASVYRQSSDNWLDGDPGHPSGCDLEDAHSLCHWFSNLA